MATLADDLKQVPLFSGLNKRQLKRLSRDFKERTFLPGTTPVRQGQMSGIGFFVVTEGEASVSVSGREVARLGPGEDVGERGRFGDRERMATVTAYRHFGLVQPHAAGTPNLWDDSRRTEP